MMGNFATETFDHVPDQAQSVMTGFGARPLELPVRLSAPSLVAPFWLSKKDRQDGYDEAKALFPTPPNTGKAASLDMQQPGTH